MKNTLITIGSGLVVAGVFAWFIVLAFVEVALLGRWHDAGLDKEGDA